MTETNGARDFAAYVDDRPGDGVFRVDREVYLDEEILEAELKVFSRETGFTCATSPRSASQATISPPIWDANRSSWSVARTAR